MKYKNPPFSILHKHGFSLVEMLFYIALFSISLIAVMQTLSVMVLSYGAFRASQHIQQDAAFSMERLIREIRDARSIADSESVFLQSPGRLFLNSTTVSGAVRSVEVYLEDGRLSLREDGAITGFLTSDTTTISNLVFRKITTPRSLGVKIEMRIEAGSGASGRSEDFYSTAVLRDSH